MTALATISVVVGPATGQPGGRRVALINAARNPAAGAAATAELRALLVADAELAPLAPGDLSRALEGEALDVVDPQVAAIDAELASARQALDRFESRKCLAAATRAEDQALELPPSPGLRRQLATGSFLAGLCHLREQNLGLAGAAFGLAVRLDRSLAEPDPARYPPEVVTAVKKAARPSRGVIDVAVSATFDGAAVEVDGEPVGVTPWRGQLSSGLHLVQVAAPTFRPAGRIVDASGDQPLTLRIDLTPRPAADQARALRATLMADPAGRLAELGAATDLAGADAALVVLDDGDGLAVAVYQRADDRLSVPRPLADAAGLLGLLAPTPTPAALDLGRRPPVDRAPWYLRPWGVATLTGGALIGAALAITLGTSGEETQRRPGVPQGFE